ncbi:MAG: hypothetical protein JRD69_05945 [Deltaproteobacteria bacterium]|nr:hypothetical protein [Deltaproteobacteria bacterium]
MVKLAIDFQKTAFDNSFNVITLAQQQMERMVDIYLSQTMWLPEEGKKVINEWVNTCSKGRENFKKAVDGNYKRVEDFFANVG